LNKWFSHSGLDQEIEDSEREILLARASELDERSALNACWRWEGAAVLAASLGRLTLPSHDETNDTRACGEACGLMAPRDEIDRLIANASFDPGFDRFAYANQVLAIHWRLRQFVHVEQKPLDFRAYAAVVYPATTERASLVQCGKDEAVGVYISDCPRSGRGDDRY
jgi:hypothetical protein